jgi:hypothetical protein
MQISKSKSCVSLHIPFNFIENNLDFNNELNQSTTAMEQACLTVHTTVFRDFKGRRAYANFVMIPAKLISCNMSFSIFIVHQRSERSAI